MASHEILGGKVLVYRRENSKRWQCSTRINGRNWRMSTGEDSLALAKEFAEDWFFRMKAKEKGGGLKDERSFKEAAKRFLEEYDVITGGTRNRFHVVGNERRLRLYLLPFFGELGLSEVTAGKVQEYRVMRYNSAPERVSPTSPDGKPEKKLPAKSTLHKEIVTLRQVLKTAIRHGWLAHLPDLSMPYKSAEKIAHRAWFSSEEYKRLYTATRNRVDRHENGRFHWHAEQLHDYVLFMANTGLRPDEANRLQYRDVEIVEDEETKETILLIQVRGKRGVGYCKSMPSAVFPFERLLQRNLPKPDDLMFPGSHLEMFNNILEEEGLKFDREGNRRTAYSLRHTYICLRLMEGADIYQIAKNCRTSVEMIEKYYASHISTSISAAAVNVKRKAKSKKQIIEHEKRNAHRAG
ncbi:integrase [Rhizobium pisi]|uniref:Site-specific integrase n=2 Tax=Rhizobium/Agrobacterium group TaxID=227290 RepID=A0A427N2N5_9HYPH|nr:site-specific integrase [Rhizobium pisi]RSB81116.1 site-specific integrase [Rhizobium pisi]TCA60183.1 site-specific integrase [Rhizobium pisi]